MATLLQLLMRFWPYGSEFKSQRGFVPLFKSTIVHGKVITEQTLESVIIKYGNKGSSAANFAALDRTPVLKRVSMQADASASGTFAGKRGAKRTVAEGR